MKLMIKYLKKHFGLCLLNLFCVLGFVMTELGLPYMFSKMVDQGVLAKNQNVVFKYMFIMILLTIGGIILNLVMSTIVAKITTKIVREIREDLFFKIQMYSQNEYEKIGNSSLITRLTNDAYQIMMFLSTVLRIGFISPIMFGFSIYLIMSTNIKLSIIVFISLPILAFFVFYIGKKTEPISVKQQQQLDGINQIIRENLSGIRVIRAFSCEDFEEDRFKNVNNKYQQISQKLFSLMAINQPGFNFIFFVAMTILLWIGAKQVSLDNLAIGNYMAIIEYVFHAMFSLMLFATMMLMYPRVNVSAKRILEAYELELVMKDSGQLTIDKDEKVDICFNNVTFSYNNNPIVKNVSFNISSGETVAFVGGTGSGKSTLLQLIPRLYDVSSGEILLNNHNIKQYKLESLRSIMGYVPQKSKLFSGTIKENLLFGNSQATDQELWKALEISESKTFVEEKEQKLLSEVSEGGSNFSGGQKQRLAIARAIIRKPRIYLFDDSFSALDFKTDRKLRQNLEDNKDKNDITIIVAQRISTIMNADKIIVLDKGQVVGIGNHKHLLQTCEKYLEIAKTQMSEEELQC